MEVRDITIYGVPASVSIYKIPQESEQDRVDNPFELDLKATKPAEIIDQFVPNDQGGDDDMDETD